MSRQASELTEAIRDLCKKTKGKITHAEARPKLIEMGFEMLPEDTDRSSDDWKAEANAFNTTKYQWRKSLDNSNGSTSTRPAARRSTRSNQTSAPPAKHSRGRRKSTATPESFDLNTALAYVKENGGMQAVLNEIDELKKKIVQHEAAVNKLQTVQTEIEAAA